MNVSVIINKPAVFRSLFLLFLLIWSGGTYAQVQGVPMSLSAGRVDSGGVISFTQQTIFANPPVSNYEYSTDNGATWVAASPAVTASPLRISGLTNCTTYQIKLRAVNASGAGPASSAVNLTPIPTIDSPGLSWMSRSSANSNYTYRNVAYGNGVFIAVADSGIWRMMNSSNGISWNTIYSGNNSNAWSGITYGNGLFVAVAETGTGNRVMTSSNGSSWTTSTSAADNSWQSVTYGNGLFVAVASTGTNNRVMTSPDGITWTSRTSAANNSWRSISYGNGLFVAVAIDGTNRVMTSPDGITWTSRSAAAANTWYGITYGNGLFVAVSSDGTGNRVMTSPDGITWTARTSAANNSWRSVTYGNGIFVAVSIDGTGNRVMTSPDGIAWTVRTSAADNQWTGVTFGNGQFVAVSLDGTNNRVMTNNNIVWTVDAPVITSISAQNNSASVVFTQTASSYAPTISNYEYSTDNGSTWTARNPASSLSPMFISGLSNGTTYNIKIRAINAGGTSCESNAISVTPALAAPTNVLLTPLNTGGMIQFIAPEVFGGSAITNYEYSTDNGATWVTPSPAVTETPLIISSGLANCTTYPFKLRAVNAFGGGTASTAANLTPRASTDGRGTTWTRQFSAVANAWSSITFGNGLFVAVAGSGTGNRIMTSPNGVTWTARTSAEDNAWQSVTYGNGLFVAVSSTGTNRVMTSPNGITWTARPATALNLWQSVTYGNGLFVAVSADGTNRVMTSPDGITWTARNAAAANFWQEVTYGNGLFVAVSYDGTNRVMTSPDGITWTSRTAAAVGSLTSVTYGNGLFVAVATNNTNRVMTSTNGTTWTARTAALVSGWQNVYYGNGLFVALSYDGIMTSPDGIAWTSRSPSADIGWSAISYGNGLFVVLSADLQKRIIISSLTPAADAPVITSITTRNNTASVAFTQTAPVYASEISNYEYSTDNGSTWTASNPPTYISPMTITGLSTGTTYTIKIRAINTGGASCESNAMSATTALGTVSGAPTDLVVTPLNTGGMIQFTPPANDGGSAITNYEYSTDNGSTWVTPSPAVTESPLIISSGLVNCTTYPIQIRAVNASGNSTATAASNLTPNVSTDEAGITWRTRTSPITNRTSVAYGNGRFVAVGSGGSMRSSDGINWTYNAAPSGTMSGITFAKGLFVAVGSSSIFTSPDGITWTARSVSRNIDLTSITFGNGMFVALGGLSSESVMTSPDGINWTFRTAFASYNDWNSVTYGNGLFVAVHDYGSINNVMTSPNGITWTNRNGASTNTWKSVTYGNGLFVAVSNSGTGNRVMTSPDGITWTSRTSAADNNWFGVTYGNGLFVAVSQSGTGNRVMTSPDGITWTSRTSGADSNWTAITQGNGLFVAVASIGTAFIMTSSFNVAANAPVITAITPRSNSVRVAFTQTASASASVVSNYEYSTDNGSTWTARTSPSNLSPITITGLSNGTAYNIRIRAINSAGTSCASAAVSATPSVGLGADAPTNLVVTPLNTGGMIQFTAPVNDGGSDITNYQYSTDNGATWVTPSPAVTESPLIISSGLSNCTSYPTQIRAVNAAGGGTATAATNLTPRASTNTAINWVSRTAPAANLWGTVTYGNGLFVAVSSTGSSNRVMTSPDGITWTARASAADNQWSDVTYGNGLFVAVSFTGSGNRVMTSPDGINWTSRLSATENNWQCITFGNGLFVALATTGTGNRVMTSLDGITWTSRTSAGDFNWYGVTFGNGLFVAVSLEGPVMTSPDGITWTSRTAARNNYWTSVTYGNGLYVAVAGTYLTTTGGVMTSSDGITWTWRSSADNAKYWKSVTYGNGLFVAVANSGTGNRVMTSPDGITWTSRTSAEDNNWFDVAYGNGLFAAVSLTGTSRVMTSSFVSAANAPVLTSATFGTSTTVNFTQSSAAIAPAITNYQYSTNNGSSWTAVSPAATTSPITISGFATAPNSITMRAVNSVGSSCNSNTIVTCPTAAAASNLVAESPCAGASNGSARITLTGGPSYNSPVTYTVDGGTAQNATLASGFFTASGLAAGSHVIAVTYPTCTAIATSSFTIVAGTPATTTGSVTTSICAGESYTWPANGTSYTTAQSGTTFVSGCNTATLNLTILPASVGGTVAGGTTICTGSTSALLTLSGHSGTITKWQSAVSPFSTWTDIENTATTFTSGALTATTQFRAVVQSGSCAVANSEVTTVTVNPTTVGGTVTGGTTICLGSTSALLTLSGNTGTVTKWQSSVSPYSTWTDIENTATTYTSGALTATTQFRAVVQSGSCSSANSNSAAVSIVTTTWNGTAWDNGAPTDLNVKNSIVFTGNYSSTASIYGCAMQVTNNAIVTLNTNDNLILDGALTVESGSNFTMENNSNLIQNTDVANTGSITVKRKSSPLFRLDYTLWSSPVIGSQSLLNFSPLTTTNRFYTYNTTTNLYNSIPDPSTTPFSTAKGYLIRMPNNWISSSSGTPAPYFGSFTGVPRNGPVSVSGLIDGGSDNYRYNAVGNPYPSAVQIEEFITQNNQNIYGTIWMWRKTNDQNNPISYSNCTIAGCTTNNGHTFMYDDNFISIGQGFIVQMKPNQSTLNFTNSMRIASNVDQFFRTSQSDRFWLDLTNSNNTKFGQYLMAYIDGTTNYDDGLDGLYINDCKTALTSIVDGNELTINARPNFDEQDLTAVQFKTDVADTYTISINRTEGVFSGNQEIFIRDNQLGIVQNLKTGSYSFASNTGTFANRFDILYQNPTLATTSPIFNEESVVVYKNSSNVYIDAGTTNIDSVKLFDIRGRMLIEQKKVNATQTKIDTSTIGNQVLLVQITSENQLMVTKKILN